jgi:hypothetical protein
MSAVDAAVRQRQNEGLAMQTLGTNLNLLGAQSGATGFVNQLRAQAAGQTSPWASLFSNILGGTANSAAKNGWFSGSPPADSSGDIDVSGIGTNPGNLVYGPGGFYTPGSLTPGGQ